MPNADWSRESVRSENGGGVTLAIWLAPYHGASLYYWTRESPQPATNCRAGWQPWGTLSIHGCAVAPIRITRLPTNNTSEMSILTVILCRWSRRNRPIISQSRSIEGRFASTCRRKAQTQERARTFDSRSYIMDFPCDAWEQRSSGPCSAVLPMGPNL